MVLDGECPAIDLAALFARLNELHFGGKLQAQVVWSNRMRVIAGNCDWQRGIIRLSRQYHAKYPQHVESTLLHEMLHLALRRGHDAVYKAAAARLGVLMRAQGQAEHRPYKYLYVCPSCGLQVKRRRKGNWSCGVCGKGKYNPRFRLRLAAQL